MRQEGGEGQAHHSMPFNAGDDGVDVVLVQLRLEFGAGALRVEKSIANAQVGRGVQTGDGNVNRSAKQSKSENEQADEGEGWGERRVEDQGVVVTIRRWRGKVQVDAHDAADEY